MQNNHSQLKNSLLKTIEHFKKHYPEDKNKIKGTEVFFEALFKTIEPKQYIRKYINNTINKYKDNYSDLLYDFMDKLKEHIRLRKIKFSITLPCIYYKNSIPINEVSHLKKFQAYFANDKEALKEILYITSESFNSDQIFEFSIKHVPVYIDDLKDKLSEEQLNLLNLNTGDVNYDC
tara:strand:+ start:4724 stop:5254 length:531 start_codon:yes stop_codon:yes gene_type:complete